MIDPDNVVNFQRSDEELLEFAFFCICVQGKDSHQQAKKLEQFKQNTLQKSFIGFFNYLKSLEPSLGKPLVIALLESYLRNCKMGKYKQTASAMWDIFFIHMEIGLQNVSLETLESIKYVGQKTARFFLVNTRENQPYAVLDTHLLKFLRDCGENTPKNTPTKKKYLDLEQKYRSIIMGMGVFPSPEQDLIIWKEYKYESISIEARQGADAH
jgi:hypothetical protein